MAGIGSVFLGDIQRHRVFSTSTPPSSPPGSAIYSGISSSPPSTEQPTDDNDDNIEGEEQPDTNTNPATASKDDNAKPLKAVTIDPVLSLELRLRWLEALVFGVPEVKPASTGRVGRSLRNTSKRTVSSAENKTTSLKHGETLVRLAKDLQSRLDAIVEGNEGLKRFMSHFDQHAHLLTSASVLSGVLADTRQSSASAPDYANMAPEEFEALLQEMEPDIRAADRDMREIEMLESKGVTGAGKLAEYEKLKPRLETVIATHQENLELAALLEKRIATLVRNHATQVDALSELFVAWDETLTETENKVTTLEREKAERLRLGLEQDTY
ncbi:hypothetical protein M378DRAFT_70192 [Amanita muscaria Koide BX008]|uniref:Uncharacterized protein n=1 Tax=Amanita muscaria (strain Koide BX008) TaxID=946122 RepID=A0A0C2XIE1_AMAMK|nr:hypothetical protein M378DRAFT_70192 [Amanita muscaria Koide BX008]